MNTADRSIALVDFALRRRFAFFEVGPDYDLLLRFHEARKVDCSALCNLLREVNGRIGDPHYQLGVTFFLREDLSAQFQSIWQAEIEPYLEEYFFDQPGAVDAFRWSEVSGHLE